MDNKLLGICSINEGEISSSCFQEIKEITIKTARDTASAKGPFKKYATGLPPTFDPSPCHSLSQFALTPLPLVTTQVVTNCLTRN